jgi:hypothetical protein
MNRGQNEIPSNVGVRTKGCWWALADRNRDYDTFFSNPGPGAFDYVLFSGNGSSQVGKSLALEAAIGTSQWENAANHLRSEPLRIFELRLSRSAYGFGAHVLKKKQIDGTPLHR